MTVSNIDFEAVSYLWKWSHLSHCPWSMANWQIYLGPILCTAPHAVMGSGQLLCRDPAGCIGREGSLSTIWWSKILGGLILGHQLLYHHMTGTWLNMLFPFLTVSGGSISGVWLYPRVCIFGLFNLCSTEQPESSL